MQGKAFTGVFTQYGRRVSNVRVRVSVKIRVRFRYVSGIRRVATALQSKDDVLYDNYSETDANTDRKLAIFMVALCNRADHYIFIL